MIVYEYPCNERVRAFLRAEYLFERFFYFLKGEDAHHHQIAVTTLFEILDMCERSDVRGMVLQDLERQRVALMGWREHPGVASQRLDAMLDAMQQASEQLSAQGRLGANLKENEWLSSLRGRFAVPGGCSRVDLPSYYAWQLRPAEQRRQAIQSWAQSFTPVQEAISLLLKVLRNAGDPIDHVAIEGNYQEMLGGKTFQLLRVWLDEQAHVFPEMSANKYVIWVRFAQQDNENRPQPLTKNIAFKLARCQIH
ncbi:MAG TPA: cell division protein ZapD [Candidatus Paenalcaligenes intestinipullorum]|uniref:Cell division protein ZapD n=1 Tax=Candidatus Paenalcaligenes intestinipullorum TaxID=2838718 RepID=A0A9D2RII9_9BURK|nr:cell division protein ZapD [Candidatus Paenalcaligenes intestinipullorum]